MADRPTDIPEWCRTGTATEPPEGKKDTGWVVSEKPPAEWFNWLMKIAGDWLTWYAALINYSVGLLRIKHPTLTSGVGVGLWLSGGNGGSGGSFAGGNLTLSGGTGSGGSSDGNIISSHPHYFQNGDTGLDYYAEGYFYLFLSGASPAYKQKFFYVRIGRNATIYPEGASFDMSALGFLGNAQIDFIEGANPDEKMPSFLRPDPTSFSSYTAEVVMMLGYYTGSVMVYYDAISNIFHSGSAGSITFSRLDATTRQRMFWTYTEPCHLFNAGLNYFTVA
jgi:hypothetical protein